MTALYPDRRELVLDGVDRQRRRGRLRRLFERGECRLDRFDQLHDLVPRVRNELHLRSRCLRRCRQSFRQGVDQCRHYGLPERSTTLTPGKCRRCRYADDRNHRRSQQRRSCRGLPHDRIPRGIGFGASALSVEQLERDEGLGRDLRRRKWSSEPAARPGFCERARRRLERRAACLSGDCQSRLGLLDRGHGPGGCGHDRVSGSAGWRSERDGCGVVVDRSAEHVVDSGELAGWTALGLRCRRREPSGAGSVAAERAAWARDHGRRPDERLTFLACGDRQRRGRAATACTATARGSAPPRPRRTPCRA